MSNLNPLIFPIPNALRVQYEADHRNQGLFNGDYLVLPIRSEDYQYTKLESKPSGIIGLTNSFVKIESAPFEIQATTLDSRDTIIKILQYLKEQAIINIYSYSLVTMHDYHRLETTTGYSNGYEVRTGLLDYEILGGTFRQSSSANSFRYGKGVRILFNGV